MPFQLQKPRGLFHSDMSGASGILEPVDVLEDGGLSLPACWPVLPPDQFCFDRFEECLNRCIVVTITLATH